LAKELTGRVGGLQSHWDRANSDFEKRLAELGVNLTPQQKAQNDLLEMRRKIEAMESAPKSVAKKVDVVDAIGKIGVDANDPSVLRAISQHSDNEEKLLAELARIKVSSTKPAPSAAAAIQPGGGKQPEPADASTEIAQEIENILNGPNALSPANLKKVAELREKLG
jgi:hypothetical protein